MTSKQEDTSLNWRMAVLGEGGDEVHYISA